eukprot:PhF_6_TR34709/c0_g1_i2/m.50508/K07935/IFT22, RABL5; intraflagellar transport protein 22
MSQTERVKILFVGPPKTGKTCLVNNLSGNSDHPSQDYKTCVVRVLDFDVTVGTSRRQTKVLAEVWDVSGNPKYQACWPAIGSDAQVIVFVMNPEIRNQEKELEFWYKAFADKAKVPDQCCAVFVHHSTPPTVSGPSCKPQAMPKCLAGCKVIETSLDFQSENFRLEFEKLIEQSLQYKRDQEEQKVLQAAQNKMSSGPLQIQGNQ